VTGHRFVIVECPAEDLPLASFTLRNPGTTIDLISEPAVEEGGDRLHPSLVLIKGAPPAALALLLKQLGKVYDQVEAIERDDLRHLWLGRMRIRESAFLHNKGAAIITSFQHRYRAPWTHLEDGVLHIRARVLDEAHGELLVDQMRRFMAQAGVDAQVEVREISSRDYGVWEDLIQHAIGLAP
jgi:hypothetical protein